MTSRSLLPITMGLLFLLAGALSCGAERLAVEALAIGNVLVEAEIADTPGARQKGLQNRKKLGPDAGMLFVFENEERVSFWMDDTGIPLDIAFIARDGTIRQIEAMEPFSKTTVVSRRYVRFALEVNRGWFAENGIGVGDVVTIPETYR